MLYSYLSEPVNVKTISETETKGEFEIEGLYRGYGLTIGSVLRRVLLSSIPGYAITQFKLKGVDHEFSTIPGVLENVVDMGLNLKQVRLKLVGDEPQTLTLKIKGEKEVRAKDFEVSAQVTIMNPDLHIATLTSKSAVLEMEMLAEKGLGYWSVENRRSKKSPIHLIAIDALFSPVTKVGFLVEDMRVGERADFNRLKLSVETDGSVSPSAAVRKSAKILSDHFTKIVSLIEVRGEDLADDGQPETATDVKKSKKGKKD